MTTERMHRMVFKVLVFVTRELRVLARFLGRAANAYRRRFIPFRPIRDLLPVFRASRGQIHFFKPPSPWELP